MSQLQPKLNRFYTIREAEQISRLSAKTLRNRRYEGKLPHSVRVGGRILYPIEDFELWLSGQEKSEATNAS